MRKASNACHCFSSSSPTYLWLIFWFRFDLERALCLSDMCLCIFNSKISSIRWLDKPLLNRHSMLGHNFNKFIACLKWKLLAEREKANDKTIVVILPTIINAPTNYKRLYLIFLSMHSIKKSTRENSELPVID